MNRVDTGEDREDLIATCEERLATYKERAPGHVQIQKISEQINELRGRKI